MGRLNRLGGWVERGEAAQYRAAKLAALCRVSDSQLRRFFAATIGQPPQHWLNELRLWEGGRLLCCTSLPVKCIARDLGFADKSHFCHRFKTYFGCGPSEFARPYGPGLGLKVGLLSLLSSLQKAGSTLSRHGE